MEPPSAAEINALSTKIVDAAYCVHTRVGPGLLESVYESVLAGELQRRGLMIDRQKAVPIELDGLHFDEGFRADLIVENTIVIELKSLDRLAPVHSKKLLTYLRLLNLKLGLLINFGAPTIKEGIKRVVNGL